MCKQEYSVGNTGSWGLQDPASAVLGLSQCVMECIEGLCSSMELDLASSVHAWRSVHRADNSFLGGHASPSTLHHPKAFPGHVLAIGIGSSNVRCWQRLWSPTNIAQEWSAPLTQEAGGTSDDRDLAPISHWVPWVMPPAPWVLSLSDEPRHAPNKGQTLNGDKALIQALQAGLNRLSISN